MAMATEQQQIIKPPFKKSASGNVYAPVKELESSAPELAYELDSLKPGEGKIVGAFYYNKNAEGTVVFRKTKEEQEAYEAKRKSSFSGAGQKKSFHKIKEIAFVRCAEVNDIALTGLAEAVNGMIAGGYETFGDSKGPAQQWLIPDGQKGLVAVLCKKEKIEYGG